MDHHGRKNEKTKTGSIEILGCIGLLIWVTITLLRSRHLSVPVYYQFFIGILPNLGAAWAMTMFAKWFWVLAFKRTFSLKTHIIICISIVVLALGSEIVHDLFFHSPFDGYDMISTTVAQLIMVAVPLRIKEKRFSRDA